ncbi:MAG TPA: TonB-dependent receptor, partial [Bacteroidales bacterium]|nr:TonB-dependent receptor [Bacteroidales bacterium]
MKTHLWLLAIFLLFRINIDAQEKYTLNDNYSNLTFMEFASKAEKEYGVKFFYRQAWVKDIRLKDYPQCKTLDCLLDNLFRNTNLHYLIEDSGNIVITNNFEIKVVGMSDNGNKKFLAPTESAASQEDMQAGNKVVEVGNPAEKNNPGSATITGYIRNKDTGEPVAGVTVIESKLSSGTISNEFGFYSFKIPRGFHTLRFTFVGMKEKNVNLNLFSNGNLDVEMNSVLIPLKEAIVSAQKNVTLQRFEVGAEKININTFRIAPTSMGEPDIIKNILLIPGVQSVGEGSAGFNVRGGSADQNLVLLYGAPVYNTSHFFGFFSAVNSDIIKDVTLYKGGIPARYGGRLSSVLDIGAEDGDRKEFKGNAGISPVTTHLKFEGPVKKDTLTYLLTARTTYSNYLLRLIDNPFIGNSRASFWDINGKITYYANKNNRIDFSSYFSHDDFRFRSDTTYIYNNAILAMNWRHFFTDRFLSTFSVNNSSYSYDVTETSFAPEAFSLSHMINSTSAKA